VGNTVTAKPVATPGPTKGALGLVISITTAQWATAFLRALQAKGYKAPVNATNIANIQRLIEVESAGNDAGFMRDNNPFNLNTWKTAPSGVPHTSLPGGTIVQEWGVDVQTFPTVDAGINATVNQFVYNSSLVKVLDNSGSASMFGGALSNSGWSSASYANATTFPTISPFTGSSALPVPITAAEAKTLAGYATGQATIKAQNPVAVVKSAVSDVTSIAGLIGDITNPTTLKNVGIFVLGLGLAGVGLLIFFSQTKGAKAAEGAAEKVA
jgi:hypothetical protein